MRDINATVWTMTTVDGKVYIGTTTDNPVVEVKRHMQAGLTDEFHTLLKDINNFKSIASDSMFPDTEDWLGIKLWNRITVVDNTEFPYPQCHEDAMDIVNWLNSASVAYMQEECGELTMLNTVAKRWDWDETDLDCFMRKDELSFQDKYLKYWWSDGDQYLVSHECPGTDFKQLCVFKGEDVCPKRDPRAKKVWMYNERTGRYFYGDYYNSSFIRIVGPYAGEKYCPYRWTEDDEIRSRMGM